jgi:predicted DCC family thiol-disulfide oxidoreductase YuxK
MQNQNLLTVNQFCMAYPAFKIGGMRAWIFREHDNGLAKSGAVLRIGRKILIDPERFFKWVEAQNEVAA